MSPPLLLKIAHPDYVTDSSWNAIFKSNGGDTEIWNQSVFEYNQDSSENDIGYFVQTSDSTYGFSPSYVKKNYILFMDQSTSNGLTYEIWVKYDGDSNLGYGRIMGVETDWGPYLSLNYNENINTPIGASPNQDQYTYGSNDDPGNISDYTNNLIHIVCNWEYKDSNGHYRKTYVNGVKYTQLDTDNDGYSGLPGFDSFTTNIDGGNFTIAASNEFNSIGVRVYGFRVWHRILSDNEVTELYEKGANYSYVLDQDLYDSSENTIDYTIIDISSVSISSPPQSVTINFTTSAGDSSSNFDLSFTSYDICYNYQTPISFFSTTNEKLWNHIFYYKFVNSTDISFCIDYTNIPYFEYSNFDVSGSALYSQYSNYPEVKYQTMIDYIAKSAGSVHALKFVKNKSDIIQNISNADIVMNQNIKKNLESRVGTQNTSVTSSSNNLINMIKDKFLSISSTDTARKLHIETKMKEYFDRLNEHENVWIPLTFMEGDKIHLSFSYIFGNTGYNIDYGFCMEIEEDPSTNLYIYSDLSSTLVPVLENGEYYLDSSNNNSDLKRFYVTKNTTYVLQDISENYPLAILNHGKENAIQYEGDSNKVVYRYFMNDDISYACYYGDVSFTVLEPFDVMSYASPNQSNHVTSYMGGFQKLWYKG